MSVQSGVFRYRCHWLSRLSRPGGHQSALLGSGFEIKENALMRLGEDPRGIDLRRSARDPLKRIWSRRFRHQSSAHIVVLADVSASMAASANNRPYDTFLHFAEMAARSAYGYGDRFALHVADESYRPELSLNTRRCAALPIDLLERLRVFKPQGKSAKGVNLAASKIGGRRGLVFVLSDFYWPLEQVEELCQILHDVQLVPVMLACTIDSPRSRLPLRVFLDAETQRQQLQLRWPWARDDSPEIAHWQKVHRLFQKLWAVKLVMLTLPHLKLVEVQINA
ncbi:MAG: DUF58 domain-containing protein [Granulosicoccaceae bacterium]